MNALRHAPWTCRLLLAAFIVAVFNMALMPLLHPQSMNLVCSASGVVKLVLADGQDDASPAQGHGTECPLCTLGSAPPPAVVVPQVLPLSPLAYVMQAIPAARLAAATAAPLPPRGPPARA